MKKIVKVFFVALTFLSLGAYASSSSMKAGNEMSKAHEQEKKGMYKEKGDVSDTSMESPDQKDPTLIEGNLEDNDFKN